jgi:hypothetical protein
LRQFHVRTGESRTGSALDRADLQRRFAAALPEAGLPCMTGRVCLAWRRKGE